MTSDTKSKNDAANQSLKYMSLVTLTVQNAMLGLSMRYGYLANAGISVHVYCVQVRQDQARRHVHLHHGGVHCRAG